MIYFILFNSIHHVLKAEKTMKEQSVEGEVVPVPRLLSSDCGVCIRSEADGSLLATLFPDTKGARCFAFDGTDYTLVPTGGSDDPVLSP
jgi:hypothetical protein